MKARSAKNKGDRFEKYLVEVLRQEIDANTHRTAGSGNGLDKNDIRIPSLNLEIEAKNANNFNIQADWEQAKRQTTLGNKTVLAIRHPRKPEFEETVIVIDFNDFLELLKAQGGTREIIERPEENKQLKYKLDYLIRSAKEVIKELEQ